LAERIILLEQILQNLKVEMLHDVSIRPLAGRVFGMECIPLMLSSLSDVSNMPCDRDMVIGHKVSSPESLGSSEP
jgi:hypothetical protein